LLEGVILAAFALGWPRADDALPADLATDVLIELSALAMGVQSGGSSARGHGNHDHLHHRHA
jgi:hypothetical protein